MKPRICEKHGMIGLKSRGGILATNQPDSRFRFFWNSKICQILDFARSDHFGAQSSDLKKTKKKPKFYIFTKVGKPKKPKKNLNLQKLENQKNLKKT